MSESAERFQLPHAPIVEAVIDIDCDYPPGSIVTAFEEAARGALADRYPKVRAQFLQEHQFVNPAHGEPQHTVRQSVHALQFRTEDEKQIIQVRAPGFSFNRLAPYSSLDDYLPEIERTWALFVNITKPIQVRKISARYINRILLPSEGQRLKLDDYLKICPRLPEQERLRFTGFLSQQSALENETQNHVNTVLTCQPPEGDKLPLIFDIETFHVGPSDPGNWQEIQARIASLRSLKNRVFKNTLTDKCLNLFQQ